MTATTTTLKKQKRTKEPASYYVYYNQWDGSIVSVSSTALNYDNPARKHIITTSDIAYKILTNQRSRRAFIVEYNSDNELVIAARSNVVVLRGKTADIINVPHRAADSRNTEWDVRFKVYKQSDILSVEVNPHSLQQLRNFHFSKKIVLDNDDDIMLFFTAKNRPDYLLKISTIDLDALIQDGSIQYDIADISKYVENDDLTVYTAQIFKTYYLEFCDEPYVDLPQHVAFNTRRLNKITKAVKSECTSHITVSQNGTSLVFNVNVSAREFADIGVNEKYIHFHLVGETPHDYIATVSIDHAQLHKNGCITIHNFEHQLSTVNLLHKHPNLLVSYKKQKLL
jgi:hypothetical protein